MVDVKSVMVLLPATLLFVAGCTAVQSAPREPEGADPVTLNANVSPKASDVTVDTVVHAEVADGTLKSASLSYTDDEGEKHLVDGMISGNEWIATDLLEPGQTYQLQVTGINADGKANVLKQNFSTEDLTLDQQTYPSVIPLQGETVGIGMPIIVKFDLPVENKAAFERKMHVTSTPAVEGSWSWLSDYEAHYRPKEYWPAGTKVHLVASLNSLPAGNGIYGQQNQDVSFTIGRAVVSTVDIPGHTLSVSVNGKVVRTMRATSGKDGFVTRSGTKLIMAKHRSVRMDAASTGIDEDDPEYYNIEDVKYAMRVTNSGEFIHAAPWSRSAQGYANVSHGCVGLSLSDAKWFYKNSKRGDPVKFVGSSRGLERQNGWTDWNISYADFKAGSALS